jgi:DNA-binding transcriptional LysR family regulator
MILKQIQYVITLAESGSFAKAADSLGITQPSLSQYVKKLEQQLGVELFDRTGGTVRLTDAGRIYIDAGRKILEIDHRMHGDFNDLSSQKLGTIVVGTTPYRSASMMPLIAKKFSELYSGMHLVIEELPSNELEDATERGQFDVCLTMLPINTHIFQYEKISEEELLLAVPKSFAQPTSEPVPNRKYPSIDATELNGMPFVMITESQYMQRALDNLAIDHQLKLKRAAVVKSLEAQIAMVRSGVGMALMPSGIERFCSPNEVCFYSLKQELPKREVVVMWKKDRHLNNATISLLQTIRSIQW